MNNIYFFLLFTIIMFVGFIFAKKFFGKNALFVIGIGSVIGANIYNANAIPIQLGGLILGIDSVVYTLFVFSAIIMHLYYGKYSMREVLYSAVGSIFLTSLLSFTGNAFQVGVTDAVIYNSLSYFFSILGTVVAIEIMIYIFDKLKKKNINIYLNIAIGLVIASLVNSAIYYGLAFLAFGGLGDVFVQTLAGSYVGKGISLLFCLGAYYFGTLLDKRKKVKEIKN